MTSAAPKRLSRLEMVIRDLQWNSGYFIKEYPKQLTLLAIAVLLWQLVITPLSFHLFMMENSEAGFSWWALYDPSINPYYGALIFGAQLFGLVLMLAIFVIVGLVMLFFVDL